MYNPPGKEINSSSQDSWIRNTYTHKIQYERDAEEIDDKEKKKKIQEKNGNMHSPKVVFSNKLTS